ncbi:MAG: threonine synthase [Spirochaetaceae bacterium]|jgi:threonine synthase|nr:threonine synthase [Spirochaetaceae bacterium]
MRYYSTRNTQEAVSFADAALRGLAADGGLFIPEELPRYSAAIQNSFASMNFLDLAFETIRPYVHPEIPDNVLEELVAGAFNFPVPLVQVGAHPVLELFHGPTAAFKDFGARFMARAFAYLRRGASKPLKILVATSGDTGGAVASGFLNVEGITVTVLYPKGGVSPLQEKQIAGLGGAISAVAVEGTFDDCQRLVKAAFSHPGLRQKLDFSSANSINIARLIPQAVYYSTAVAALLNEAPREKIVITVPSGNFGNLTAGLYAQAMGAPISRFIAATNINKTFPCYLETGLYEERPSVATISNAMDVGSPSNFERMKTQWPLSEIRRLLASVFITDDATRAEIKRVFDATGYVLDPHGAVGHAAAALCAHQGVAGADKAIILETAHPAKFAATVEPLTGPVPLPPQLAEAAARTAVSTTIPVSNEALAALLAA